MTAQPRIDPAWPPRPARARRARALRLVLLGVTLAAFAVTAVEHPTPLVIALGVVPIAWLLIEAVWHLSADQAGAQEGQDAHPQRQRK